jgi:hypothetical protein
MVTSRSTGTIAVLLVVVTAIGALVSVLGLLASSYVVPSAVVLAVVAAVAFGGGILGTRAANRLGSPYW